MAVSGLVFVLARGIVIGISHDWEIKILKAQRRQTCSFMGHVLATLAIVKQLKVVFPAFEEVNVLAVVGPSSGT